MRTLDNQSVPDAGLWQSLRRDAALLLRFAGMLFFYLSEGRRIRREYRRCAARGEIYWLDEAPPESERRAR